MGIGAYPFNDPSLVALLVHGLALFFARLIPLPPGPKPVGGCPHTITIAFIARPTLGTLSHTVSPCLTRMRRRSETSPENKVCAKHAQAIGPRVDRHSPPRACGPFLRQPSPERTRIPQTHAPHLGCSANLLYQRVSRPDRGVETRRSMLLGPVDLPLAEKNRHLLHQRTLHPVLAKATTHAPGMQACKAEHVETGSNHRIRQPA